MLVRITLATVLSAPALLLTACGGGTSSVADPPVSTVTSATPNPPKRETPEHFIRRWAKAEQVMENTGHTSSYLALSRRCKSCRALAAQVVRFYKSGGYVRWKGRRIRSMHLYGHRSATFTYAVRVVAAPTLYRPSSDAPIEHLAGGPSTELITINKAEGQWTVVGYATLAQ